MKKLILILSIFLISFKGGDTQKFKVLDTFILGESTVETISDIVDTSNTITVYDDSIRIDTIVCDSFLYKKDNVKINLIFINNKLFSVRYFPPNDELFLKYEKYLNRNLTKKFVYKIWFYGDADLQKTKNTVLVEYDMVGHFVDTYIHYDFGMVIKYPKYKKTVN